MVLDNKLGIKTGAELAREEERLTKSRAKELFESNLLADKPAGCFETLAFIHRFLFEEVYDFAGKIRQVNIAKGHFRFAPVLYLAQSLAAVEQMPQTTVDEIIDKYVEMTVIHPFREGNGRSMRLWLDHLLKTAVGQVVDWSLIDKEDYLLAMERSPVRATEIKSLIQEALTHEVSNRQIYFKGLDASYAYEGYTLYKTEDL